MFRAHPKSGFLLRLAASKVIVPALVLALGLGAASCMPAFHDDDIIVEVNGRGVNVEEFNQTRAIFLIGDESPSSDDRLSTRNTVLKYLIRRAVILSTASDQSFQPDETKWNTYLKSMQDSWPTTALEEMLLERKMTLEQWHQRIKEDFIIAEFLNGLTPKPSKPSLSAKLAYYEKNGDQFQQKPRAEVIIAVAPTRELIETVREKIKNKRQELIDDFKNTPHEQSFSPQMISSGALSEELDTLVFKTPAGRVSHTLETSEGFKVVYVVRRFPSLILSFDQVRHGIETALQEEYRQEALARLQEEWLRKASIRYNRKLIASM